MINHLIIIDKTSATQGRGGNLRVEWVVRYLLLNGVQAGDNMGLYIVGDIEHQIVPIGKGGGSSSSSGLTAEQLLSISSMFNKFMGGIDCESKATSNAGARNSMHRYYEKYLRLYSSLVWSTAQHHQTLLKLQKPQQLQQQAHHTHGGTAAILVATVVTDSNVFAANTQLVLRRFHEAMYLQYLRDRCSYAVLNVCHMTSAAAAAVAAAHNCRQQHQQQQMLPKIWNPAAVVGSTSSSNSAAYTAPPAIPAAAAAKKSGICMCEFDKRYRVTAYIMDDLLDEKVAVYSILEQCHAFRQIYYSQLLREIRLAAAAIKQQQQQRVLSLS